MLKKSIVYQLQEPFHLSQEAVCFDLDNLGDFQLYAQTEYTVVSKGTELAAWQGERGLRADATYPRLLGYCNLAKVHRVGKKITTISPGDYILTHQAHRTDFVCDLKDVLLKTKESNPALRKKITTSYLYYLAYHSLLLGEYKPGYAVSIIGFGVLGFAVSRLAALFGAEPIIFSNQAVSCKDMLVYPKESPNGAILPPYAAKGFDLVINTSSQWKDHFLAMQIAKTGGNIVYMGFPGKNEKEIPHNPLDSQFFYAKNLSIKHCGYPNGLNISNSEDFLSAQRGMKYIEHLITTGKLEQESLINFEASWEDLNDVYQDLKVNKHGFLTALLTW